MWGFNCVGEIKVAPQGAGQATYADETKVISDPNQLGRLAPYLERPCLRPATPTESSVPRMMW
jgi:hypothetical protein